MKKIGVVSFLLLVLNLAAIAQTPDHCVISGYISDAASGEAIAGANLKIVGEPYGAAANLHGFYSIPRVPKGVFTLSISAIGYETVTREIVCTGEPIRIDIEIRQKAIVGEEVVVEAQRVGGMEDPYVGHAIVKQDIILRSPGFLEADLFRTLQTMTGVMSISDYSSGLYIWGSTPSGNMVLLDNIEVYNPTHLFGLTSSFIADAIREANLVKGGYPAKWGGRLGSVLEITNKDGNRKEFEGIAELSAMSGQLLLEGPVGNGSFMAAGRRTWIDLATGLMASADMMEEKLPYSFYDFQSRINQEFSPRDRLTLSFYSGDDVLAFEDDDEDEYNDDFEYRWGNFTTSLQWKHIFHDRLFGHMVLAGSRFRAKFLSGDGYYDRLNTIGDVTAKGDLTYFHSKEHTLNFGGMLKWREIRNNDKILVEDWDWVGDSVIERIEEWDNYTNASLIALYAEEEYKPNALWKFQLGLRSEFAFNGNYFRVGPRFSGQRMIDDKTTLRLAMGQYYQYIHLYNPAEDQGMAFLDFWIPVDKNVKPGSAQHFVLGFDTDHLPVHLSANAYFKNMNNLLVGRETFVLILEDNIRTQFYVGSGRAAGFDVSLDGEWGNFGGWLGYSLGWVQYSMGDSTDGINGGDYYSPKFDRRHNLNFSLGYKISPRVDLTAVYTFGSGQPTTELDHWELEYYYWEGDSFYYPVYSDEFNGGRLPYYNRFDIGMRWKMVDREKWDMFMFVQVLNLFNHENYLFKTPDYKKNDIVYYDEMKNFPRIPYFGFRAEF